MIRVIYDGRLGNNLFQYCFGRILAEQLGYQLVAEPICGFPRTAEIIRGNSYDSKPLILRGQKPNLDFLDGPDPRRQIVLTGYFQRYEYFESHAPTIRSWLRMEADLEDITIGEDDVVVGIRRGSDYVPRHALPLSYFEEALSIVPHGKVYICSDSPDDPFVRYIAKRYSAGIRHPGAIDNLSFIKKFRRIIISNSTFLWWGAFLSDARQIVFPRPANGFWSNSDPVSKHIALEVPESRYIYLPCNAYRSQFVGEIVRNRRDNLLTGLKAILQPVVGSRRRTTPEQGKWMFREE